MIKKINQYFQGVIVEFKKVTWPTRKELQKHTVIVIVSVVIAMVFFGLIDLGFTKLLEFIIYKG